MIYSLFYDHSYMVLWLWWSGVLQRIHGTSADFLEEVQLQSTLYMVTVDQEQELHIYIPCGTNRHHIFCIPNTYHLRQFLLLLLFSLYWITKWILVVVDWKILSHLVRKFWWGTYFKPILGRSIETMEHSKSRFTFMHYWYSILALGSRHTWGFLEQISAEITI